MKDLPRVEDFKSESEFLDAFDLFIDFKTKIEKNIAAEEDQTALNEFKLIALRYALKNSPIYPTITTDGRATFASLRSKVRLFFTAAQEPCSEFFKLSISDYSGIDQYLLDCRRKAKTLMGEQCPNEYIEKLIIQLTSEQFVASFQCVLKPRTTTWASFVECLRNTNIQSVLKTAASVNSVRQSPTSTCFNCGTVGHISYQCTKKKVRCNSCLKFGHLRKFCRQKTMAICNQELETDRQD